MTSAPPLSPLTTSEALPLDGHLVHLPPAPPAGLATATEVVRDHLTRLGARFGPGAGPWHPDGSAAQVRDRYATAGPETVIGLSGPHTRGTDLTLRGWPAGDPTPFDETTAQAATGLMALHGRANGGPRPLGTDYLSTLTGVVATQALLAAALSGLRGTPVRSTRVSVTEAALFSLGPYLAAATAGDEAEEVPSPPYRRAARPPFLSADGVRFEVEALEVQPWRDFWKAVGAPAKDIANSWRAFAARHTRAASPLITTLAQCAARHRYADLLLIAERTGMGLCALRTLADRRADSDVRYDDDPWELRELPRDERDGLPAPPYTSARPHTGFPQLPLGGLRVVESTRGIQGPLATSVLQALGAHVIRIEQPGGDPSRGAAPLAGGVSARFAALNAGKEVRETDIRTAAGRRAVAETVAEADVFLHTWAPGEAARLRLDEADLARARPGLIYAWASAWDRAPDGPRPAGTDPMVQAWSGVADTVRTPDGTPAPSLVTLLDVLGGHLAAESVLAALLARESGAATGRLRVDSSLLGASRVLLRPLLRGLDEAPGTQPAEAGLVAPTADGLIAVGAGAGTTPAELATAPTAAWLGRLHAAGIPARAVVTDLAALPQDPTLSPYFTHDGCARPTPPLELLVTAATASVPATAPAPTTASVPTTAPAPTIAPVPADARRPDGVPRPTASHDEAVAAARAIAPRLGAYAAEADWLRTLPAEAVRLLDDARLFDVLTPRVWGGGGLGFATALLTTEELSRGCASVGWLRAVMGGNTWTVAQFPVEARQEVFSAPSTRVALQLRLSGPPARRVPGGYLLRGMWGRFCSGIDHAEWIVAGVSAPAAPGAAPEPHLMLLPQERTVGIDDWHTSGLRGTGSRSFTVPELLVPDHRVLPLSALDPGSPSPHGRPRTTPYRMAFAAVGTVALAGVLLGAARAALDAYAGSPSGASGLDVSALTATVDTARAMLLADLDTLAASSTPGGTPEERARMRRDIAYAGTRCREVVNAVYEASGSAVIYDDAPVQRIWRDANAAAQHPTFDLRRWGATPS